MRALQAAYRKAAAANPRDDGPTADQIRSLGLLKATPEEKRIKQVKWLPYQEAKSHC